MLHQGIEKPAVSSGFCEADERARTVDLLHGKQTLYQLSYIRERAEYSRRLDIPDGDDGLGALRVELRAEQRRDVLGIRIAPEHRLREHELAVHVDVEDAVRARHDLERADDVFPVLENRRRQTGGVRLRASGDAVLDPHVMSVGHRAILADDYPWPAASSASFTRLSASSLCSRRTAV